MRPVAAQPAGINECAWKRTSIYERAPAMLGWIGRHWCISCAATAYGYPDFFRGGINLAVGIHHRPNVSRFTHFDIG